MYSNPILSMRKSALSKVISIIDGLEIGMQVYRIPKPIVSVSKEHRDLACRLNMKNSQSFHWKKGNP